MIAYLPNDDVAPIVDYIKRGMLKAGHLPSAREADAIARLFRQIDLEKKGYAYQVWERNRQDRQAVDNAARARPPARKPVRKRRKS